MDYGNYSERLDALEGRLFRYHEKLNEIHSRERKHVFDVLEGYATGIPKLRALLIALTFVVILDLKSFWAIASIIIMYWWIERRTRRLLLRAILDDQRSIPDLPDWPLEDQY